MQVPGTIRASLSLKLERDNEAGDALPEDYFLRPRWNEDNQCGARHSGLYLDPRDLQGCLSWQSSTFLMATLYSLYEVIAINFTIFMPPVITQIFWV
jgi:hypothetical protein